MPSFVVGGHWALEAEMEVGADRWKNTIDIVDTTSGTGPPPASTDGIVQAWKNFMIAVHYSDTTIVQVTLRPIVAVLGSPSATTHPPIFVLAVGSAGTAETLFGGAHNSNFLPKSAGLLVKKTTLGGRSGHQLMRNILTEVDVSSPLSGDWEFSPGAGHFQKTVFDSEAATVLGPFFEGGTDTNAWDYCVMHLLDLHDPADIRVPYSTKVTTFVAERPAWNKARR